jgi:effector-binding domain-containing protein
MQIEIIDAPHRISLVGYHGTLDGESVPVVGKRLMDKMWREVQALGLKSKGINHWVYLPDSMMFTGIELAEKTTAIGTLEPLTVSLNRYLRFVHTGPYSELPQIWPQLVAEIKQRGETPTKPSLEIYGHWNEDPSKCETTILISL